MRLLLTICAVFVSTSLWAQSSENAALNGWGPALKILGHEPFVIASNFEILIERLALRYV